jgi:hypothetical protein
MRERTIAKATDVLVSPHDVLTFGILQDFLGPSSALDDFLKVSARVLDVVGCLWCGFGCEVNGAPLN